MITKFVEQIQSLGVKVQEYSQTRQDIDTVLDVEIEGERFRLVIYCVNHAPYPSKVDSLESLHKQLKSAGVPLLLAPFVSVGLGISLIDAGWSWADTQGNFDLRVGKIRLMQRIASRPVRRRSRGLPGGTGGLSILRLLIHGADAPVTVTELAKQTGVTQPRVSQVLTALTELGLVERVSKTLEIDRESLLDAFLAEYRGPGGQESYYYSLDSLQDVAARLSVISPHGILTSADVGPDFLVPWRNPTVVVLYARAPFVISSQDLVEAESRVEANVIIRYPSDNSVFRVGTISARVAQSNIQIVHPTQMLWDLYQLGGEDRVKTAERLREWLMQTREIG